MIVSEKMIKPSLSCWLLFLDVDVVVVECPVLGWMTKHLTLLKKTIHSLQQENGNTSGMGSDLMPVCSQVEV